MILVVLLAGRQSFVATFVATVNLAAVRLAVIHLAAALLSAVHFAACGKNLLGIIILDLGQ